MRPSGVRRPRSWSSLAGGAPGGPPRWKPGGRPARSSLGESSHLRRLGEADPRASSSPHPGPGPRRLSRVSGRCSGRGLREGALRGERWRGKGGGLRERGSVSRTLVHGGMGMCRREDRAGALPVSPLSSILRETDRGPQAGARSDPLSKSREERDRRNSRKTTWFPPLRKMRPLHATAFQGSFYHCHCWM